MKKKQSAALLTSLLSIMLALLICLGCLFIPSNTRAQAKTYSLDNDLHKQTKIYSKYYSDDYFDGCEDYSNYTSTEPSITVFTPGLGSGASVFSNFNGGGLAYYEYSIIGAICKRLRNNVDIYYAKCTSDDDWKLFQLYKLDIYDYATTDKETALIDDVSKHIIVLFESSIKKNGNQDVYEQFEYVVDSISLQYKLLAGVLPRINLVGHSRGGLTNIQYATEHPYNVATVFSMGTPYSGSTLGKLDFIMQTLEYMNEDGTYDNKGAEDIMTYEKVKQLRDNWNAVYNNTPDADINVIALGAVTSIDMVRSFGYDLRNHKKYKQYSEVFIKIADILETGYEKVPGLVPIVIDIINGLAAVTDFFGVNLPEIVDYFLETDKFDSVTKDELADILSLINIINDVPVLMDDLFIDTNSQLGYGFEDDQVYAGFIRYIKVFTEEDATTPKATDMPMVVHNIETMNSTYVNIISKSLVYGAGENGIQQLSDMTESTIAANRGTALYFAPESTGARKLAISNTSMSLYEYTETNCLTLIKSEYGELTYDFEGSHRYLIVANCDNSVSKSYEFTVESKLQLQQINEVVIPQKGSNIYLLEAEESGYYNINTSSSYVTVDHGAEHSTGNNYFVYLQAGKKHAIVFSNSNDQPINAEIYITKPYEAEFDSTLQISSDKKVVSFTNPYNTTVRFKLTVTSSGDSRSASVFNCDNSSIATVVTSAHKKVLYFTLSAHEECFVVFSHVDDSINAQVGVDEQQLRWKINNLLYVSEKVQLPRGEMYDVQLVLFVDGQYIDRFVSYVTTSRDEYFIFADGKLQIFYAAVLEYDIVIVPMSAPEYLLTITVGKGREDIDYTVTLDRQGGTSGTTSIMANYNRILPTAIAPKRAGYKFQGYYSEAYGKGTQYYDASMTCVHIWDIEGETTLYAYWEIIYYNLTLFNGDNASSIAYKYKMVYGEDMPDRLFAPTREGYTFKGYFTQSNGKGVKYYNGIVVDDRQGADMLGTQHNYIESMEFCYSERKWLRESDLTLYAHWEIMKCTYYLQQTIEAGEEKTDDLLELSIVHGQSISVEAPSWKGAKFLYFADGLNTSSESTYSWTPLLYRETGTGKIAPQNPLLAVYEKSCVAAGTLITLADGRQVPVETLTGNERLLVWNLLTGKFDSAKILFIDSDPATVYQVINLHFSDGTSVKVISEHAFWNFDLNKYVYLDSGAAQYIGHWFNKQITNSDGSMGWTKVQLVNVEIREEYTTAWSPVTESHLCYYVNGMLSMPGGISGLFNIFEVDAETMKYDEVAMQADIDQYGLFTYEEFAELLPVPIEMFEAVNGQYLKVAIGKGLIDLDTLARLIERYASFFTNM